MEKGFIGATSFGVATTFCKCFTFNLVILSILMLVEIQDFLLLSYTT